MTLATIPELLAAATERFRDRPAIVTADWSESFADLANAVGRSADSLRRRGLHITDRVRHAAYTETGRSFPGWIGLRGEQRLWACLPLFHINAQAYALMTALAHGFTLALTPKFHASTFWQEARQLEVTSVNVVGAML